MAAGRAQSIQVVGLKQVQRQIRQLESKELKSELRKTNKLAADPVRDEAKRLIEGLGGSGRMAKSTTSKGGLKDASVKIGSPARVPYAGAVNYGWPAHNIKPAEITHQAVTNTIEEVGDTYEKAIGELMAKLNSSPSLRG